jgi:hypothetical protein
MHDVVALQQDHWSEQAPGFAIREWQTPTTRAGCPKVTGATMAGRLSLSPGARRHGEPAAATLVELRMILRNMTAWTQAKGPHPTR